MNYIDRFAEVIRKLLEFADIPQQLSGIKQTIEQQHEAIKDDGMDPAGGLIAPPDRPVRQDRDDHVADTLPRDRP